MTTLRDAIRKALARKRAEASSTPAKTEEPAARIRYVRCRGCGETMNYEEFVAMHNARPVFCECPPGDEDLETFMLNIEGPLEPEL